MYRGSGIMKVTSANFGDVILRSENNSLIYPEEFRVEKEKALFCNAQLHDNNVFVDKCPHKY